MYKVSFKLIVLQIQYVVFPSDFQCTYMYGFMDFCVFHFYLVPLKPGQITANKIENSSLTLAWTLTDPSPGNTTYTIYTYESIDATGTNFLMNKSSKVYGMYQFLVCINIELLFFSKDVSVLLDLFGTTIAVMRLHLIITR